MDKVETVSNGVSSTMLTNIVNPLDAVFKGAMVGVKADQLNVQLPLEDVLITPAPRLAASMKNSNGDAVTSMGDLIDNSIDANAERIQIMIGKIRGQRAIVISDDGWGMTKEVLINALTLGLHNDSISGGLGRFGMGLKISCGNLGDCFEILTRVEDGQLFCGVFDYNKIKKENRWVAQAGPASIEQVQYFEKMVGKGSGTILTIKDTNWKTVESMKASLEAPLKKYLGRTFRYWLTPIEKSSQNKFVKGKITMTLNGEEVLGTDPLERHVKNTKTVLDTDVNIGNGRTVHVIVTLLDKDQAPVNKKDRGSFHFIPNQTAQGISVVRENREILQSVGGYTQVGGDFSPIWWGGKRMELNFIRMELRYTNLDDVFVVTPGKEAVKHIDQSVMDILANILRPWVKRAQDIYRAKEALEQVTDAVIQEYHDSVSKLVEDKASILILPSGRKIERSQIEKGKKGTIRPNGTAARRYGVRPNTKSKVKNFSIKLSNWSSEGPVFKFIITDKDGIEVTWNVAHAYYVKHIVNKPKDQVVGIDLMAVVMSSMLLKKISSSEDPDEATCEVDNYMQDVSSNLRSLSS